MFGAKRPMVVPGSPGKVSAEPASRCGCQERQGRLIDAACSPPGGGPNLSADCLSRAVERDVRACHEHSSVPRRFVFAFAQDRARRACLRAARGRQEVVVCAAGQVRRRGARRQASQGRQVVRRQEAGDDGRQAERLAEAAGSGCASPAVRRIRGRAGARDRWCSPGGSARSARLRTRSTGGISGRLGSHARDADSARRTDSTDWKSINYDNPFVFAGSIDGGPGGDLHGDGQRDIGYG